MGAGTQSNEVIIIAAKKPIDWNTIRAEYIGGGISQRKLAEKHGVSETTLMKKANAEGWHELRAKADSKSTAKAQQKTAEAAADNAVLAERIKRKVMLKLERVIDAFGDDATESRVVQKNKMLTTKLSDVVKILQDLTENGREEVKRFDFKLVLGGDDDPSGGESEPGLSSAHDG